jgi:hypothetical protein
MQKRPSKRFSVEASAVNVLISVGILAIAHFGFTTARFASGWLSLRLLEIQQPHPDIAVGSASHNLPPSQNDVQTEAEAKPLSSQPTSSASPYTQFTSEEISYFLEVALGSEFGNTHPVIKKWEEPIRIRVYGSPTADDLNTLRAVIADINRLVDTIDLEMSTRAGERSPNIKIYFIPEPHFKQYEPNYEPLNYGFFWTWWDQENLDQAHVLISTTHITQKERNHLIREELTQALGLMNDSNRYPDSIFYAPWTDITSYSEIDKALIALLYRPEIHAGMTRSQVWEVLRNLRTKDPESDCAVPHREGDRNPSSQHGCENSLRHSILNS